MYLQPHMLEVQRFHVYQPPFYSTTPALLLGVNLSLLLSKGIENDKLEY